MRIRLFFSTVLVVSILNLTFTSANGVGLSKSAVKVSDISKIAIPEGWRMLSSEELKDEERSESDEKYAIVKGDFNGDGIIDEAKLLVREDGHGSALFAFVSQKGSSFKTFLLDEAQDNSLIGMGIEKVSSGAYATACGKGYWACEKDEVPEIKIVNEAIDFFRFENANSFFYWDSRINNFRRIWISD